VRPVITLLTDFGVESTYPAQMKGVILERCPEAQIVDLTHGVPRHDVRTAAFALASAVQAFAAGTIHVAVVDPQVGSSRRILAARIGGSAYLAPDNGLLSVVLGAGRREADRRPPDRLIAVQNAALFRRPVSSTFHGRDIFAPVAAELALGRPMEELGPPADTYQPFDVPTPTRQGDTLAGEVLYVDSFGNLVTNIPARLIEGEDRAALQTGVAGAVIRGLCASYSDVHAGMLLVYVGSAGFLEVAVNRQSAAARLGAGVGTPVRVRLGAARPPGKPAR
jgi:hypothetical protein